MPSDVPPPKPEESTGTSGSGACWYVNRSRTESARGDCAMAVVVDKKTTIDALILAVLIVFETRTVP